MPTYSRDQLRLIPAAEVQPGQLRRWVSYPLDADHELYDAMNGGMHTSGDDIPRHLRDPSGASHYHSTYSKLQAWVLVEPTNNGCPCGICQGTV